MVKKKPLKIKDSKKLKKTGRSRDYKQEEEIKTFQFRQLLVEGIICRSYFIKRLLLEFKQQYSPACIKHVFLDNAVHIPSA